MITMDFISTTSSANNDDDDDDIIVVQVGSRRRQATMITVEVVKKSTQRKSLPETSAIAKNSQKTVLSLMFTVTSDDLED